MFRGATGANQQPTDEKREIDAHLVKRPNLLCSSVRLEVLQYHLFDDEAGRPCRPLLRRLTRTHLVAKIRCFLRFHPDTRPVTRSRGLHMNL